MKAIKVLTIDDDNDVNNYLKVILGKNNLITETACEIEEFFKKVVDFKPDLCLVDLNLGDYEGFGYKIVQMMRKKIGPSIVIIVMSRRNSTKDISMAIESGANDYIQKPLDEDILISKINIFFNKKSTDTNLPFFVVPTADSECHFSIPMKIYSISEEAIIIQSADYVAKGSLISLHNDFIQGMSFSVKETTLDKESHTYLIRVELDDTEHAHLLPTIRSIMLKTPPPTE